MRTRSKGLGGFVAIAAAGMLAIGACGSGGGGSKEQSSPGFASCEQKPNECNSGPTKPGGSITVAIEKTLPNFNIFDNDGSTVETVAVMNGMVPSPFVPLPGGQVGWNKVLLEEQPKLTSENPPTVVYKIKKAAVWDDGSPIDVRDFELFWRLNNGKDCPKCTSATTTGYDLIKSIEGADGGKTVTVVFDKPYPDWSKLFNLYPQHAAGDWSTPEGKLKAYEFFKESPTWSGWAYKVSEYKKDVSITLVPNPKFWGTKPSLDKVTFKIIEDQAQQLPALRNKEIQMITSQPSDDMVKQVQAMTGVNYNLAKGDTWEHFDFNLKSVPLQDPALRQAIFTAVNRQTIIDKTVAAFFKGAAPLNNHFLMPNDAGYADQVSATGQGSGDMQKAKSILTGAGYKIEGGKLIGKTGQPVPPLRFRYTVGNTLRQQTAEIFQQEMKELGIDLKIETTAKLGNTLASGDYDIIIFAWQGTPWPSDSIAQWVSGGGQNYGKYANPDVDKLFTEIASTLDPKKVQQLLNQADAIMAKDAYVLPLYQKPVFLAVYSEYINVRNNPNSVGPSYNIEEWGLKGDSVK